MIKPFTSHTSTRCPTVYSLIASILLALLMTSCTPGNSSSTTSTPPTAAPTTSVPTTITNSATTTPASVATSTPTPAILPPGTLPHFDHIIVAIEENHGYAEIIGSGSAPYINSLASQGALFTDSHAITHPSEPNYLALFAGSTFGLASDACPINVTGPDLGGELLAKSNTFAGYSESMPADGFTGCSSNGLYARKHNPWVNFPDVPASANQPITNFPTDFTTLSTVSFVVPNLQNDMHDGPIPTADTWLKDHLDSYIQWAKTHNSLFILTWDEDDGSNVNHITTLFVGDHVKPGQYSKTINHYNTLSTIEDIYGLPYTHNASQAMAITDTWQ